MEGTYRDAVVVHPWMPIVITEELSTLETQYSRCSIQTKDMYLELASLEFQPTRRAPVSYYIQIETLQLIIVIFAPPS